MATRDRFPLKETLWLLSVYLICDGINLNVYFVFMTSESYSRTTRAYPLEQVLLVRKYYILWHESIKLR
jgi:hypothetical protein